MIRRWIAAIFNTAFALTLFVGGASAATISIIGVPDPPVDYGSDPKCNFVLAGPIVRGDADKLATARKRLDDMIEAAMPADASQVEIWTLRNPALCLDSAGGDYTEALQIAHVLMDLKGHAETLVPTGASCLGACGIAFLGGSELDRSFTTSPARYLDVRGRLAIGLPPTPAAKSTKAVRDAVGQLAELIGLFSVPKDWGASLTKSMPWARPSLFLNAFQIGEGRLLEIDTVGKAGRWNIPLLGVRPGEVDNAAFSQACTNLAYWREDREGRGESEFGEPFQRDEHHVTFDNGFIDPTGCVVQFWGLDGKDSGPPRIEIDIGHAVSVNARIHDYASTALWAAWYSADTKLKDIRLPR